MPARVIRLETGEESYLRILKGPPENETLRSGMVKLAPGEAVGAHCTDAYEELVIVLQGEGQASVADEGTFPVEQGTALYVPPWREHDIRNTGPGALIYVYVVAETAERIPPVPSPP
jgi:mannose-6-phosphate isomerase-like protein (cupin superfamily)